MLTDQVIKWSLCHKVNSKWYSRQNTDKTMIIFTVCMHIP